jgi:hypothetical protein
MKRLWVMYGVLFLLTGCASSGRLAPLPLVDPGKSSAKLLVYRISSMIGVTNSYSLLLDGKEVFSIRSGEHTEFLIESGEHLLGVKCFGGWNPTWKENFVLHNFSTDTMNFFEISPSGNCADIRLVSADEGRKRLVDSTFINPEKNSE